MSTLIRPSDEKVIVGDTTRLREDTDWSQQIDVKIFASVEPNAARVTETVIVVGTQSEAQTINAALSRLAISRVIVDPTVSVVVPARESEVLTVVPDVGSLLATMTIQGQLHVLDLRG